VRFSEIVAGRVTERIGLVTFIVSVSSEGEERESRVSGVSVVFSTPGASAVSIVYATSEELSSGLSSVANAFDKEKGAASKNSSTDIAKMHLLLIFIYNSTYVYIYYSMSGF
jgi:hypothetical protein